MRCPSHMPSHSATYVWTYRSLPLRRILWMTMLILDKRWSLKVCFVPNARRIGELLNWYVLVIAEKMKVEKWECRCICARVSGEGWLVLSCPRLFCLHPYKTSSVYQIRKTFWLSYVVVQCLPLPPHPTPSRLLYGVCLSFRSSLLVTLVAFHSRRGV